MFLPESFWQWLGRKRRGSRLRVDGTPLPLDMSLPLTRIFVFARLQRDKTHEADISAELLSVLRPDDVFFDVGAYVGYYSVLAGVMAPPARIVAFEMDAFSYRELAGNLAHAGVENVTLVQAAVWRESGRPLCFHHAEEPGASKSHVSATGNSWTTSLAIDDFVAASGLAPTVIKMDIEGAEAAALAGMKRSLATVRALFLELHPPAIAELGDDLTELCTFLAEAGFDAELAEGHRTSRVQRRAIDLRLPGELDGGSMLICRKRNAESHL